MSVYRYYLVISSHMRITAYPHSYLSRCLEVGWKAPILFSLGTWYRHFSDKITLADKRTGYHYIDELPEGKSGSKCPN